jgi:hypothetical protein
MLVAHYLYYHCPLWVLHDLFFLRRYERFAYPTETATERSTKETVWLKIYGAIAKIMILRQETSWQHASIVLPIPLSDR